MNSSLSFNPDQIIAKYLSAESLDRYFELLMAENWKVNLVSRETSRSDFDRLAAESLLPLDVLGGSFGRYLDIGAGGGFPAVPLMLAGVVGSEAVLVERTGKKIAALERIVEDLGLSGGDRAVRLLNTTFEDIPIEPRYDLITMRYVKLTLQLLKRILGSLANSGVFLYYSTPEFTLNSPQDSSTPDSTSGIKVETHTYSSSQDQVTKSFTIFRKTRN